jgi:ADP-ribose pyrophosphatase YjhB (NUDIX family)
LTAQQDIGETKDGSQTPTPVEQIALWSDRLRDLSAMGLHFSEDIYDSERYQVIQDIAMAMHALAADESLDRLEPLRAPLFSRPTPLVAGDAAVIDDGGRILLIQRADNQRWAMPGGALEVGETPLEGVLREVLEETGTRCQPVSLVGVFDSRRCALESRYHLYLLTFLFRPVDGMEPEAPSHAHEVLDVRWFAEDALPEDIHPGSLSRISKAYRVWRNGEHAFFDR